MQASLEWSMWLSVCLVVLVTIGYPCALVLLAPLMRRPRRIADGEPSVTLVIAAHNEEQCIAAKIENSLALDYPRSLLEIHVGSDGSTDRTNEISASFADRGVVLHAFRRMGKTGVQNQVVKAARGEILVFSDANAFYRPDALRKLVRNFADPSVGCASGQLVYSADPSSAGSCEASYWDYEKFLKKRESELSSLIGANGSIYAVRRSDYVPIEEDLISDLVEPLALVREGKRVVYEPEAISLEEASSTYSVEFARKVRILTRSIKGLLHMRALFNPLTYGVFSVQLFVHKLLRYLVPVFLLTGLGSLLGLALLGRYRLVFGATLLALTMALMTGRRTQSTRANPMLRVCHLLYYYLLVNYALIPAWINIIRGAGMTLWVPDRKSVSS